MKEKIIMPKMGESITEGTIIKWLKKEKDFIKKNENILLISTDKVEAEIPSPIKGYLAQIIQQEGKTVPVGTVLGYLKNELEENNKHIISKSMKNYSLPYFPPIIKQIIEKYSIHLLNKNIYIKGSGFNNNILKKDIAIFIYNHKKKIHINKIIYKNQINIKNLDVYKKISNIRKTIMQNMLLSKKSIPHAYTFFKINYTNIDSYKKQYLLHNTKEKLTYTSFIVFAVAKALKKHPYLNSEIKSNIIVLKKAINLNIAMAVFVSEPSLFVPIIKNTDQLSLISIAKKIKHLSYLIHTKQITIDQLSNGSFTITNPGNYGSIVGVPIINQPQTAILAVGSIGKEPTIIKYKNVNCISICNVGWLCLSFDHRIIDGIVADAFMKDLKFILESWPSFF